MCVGLAGRWTWGLVTLSGRSCKHFLAWRGLPIFLHPRGPKRHLKLMPEKLTPAATSTQEAKLETAESQNNVGGHNQVSRRPSSLLGVPEKGDVIGSAPVPGLQDTARISPLRLPSPQVLLGV